VILREAEDLLLPLLLRLFVLTLFESVISTEAKRSGEPPAFALSAYPPAIGSRAQALVKPKPFQNLS
jgi:hypothetical protein